MAVSKVDAANQIENQLPQANVANNVNFRNIIINGDMSIAQRGTSQASITSSGYYTVDRFQTIATNLGTWTQSQSTDVPSGQGFSSSLKMDCTTADASPAASDNLLFRQIIEGQNLQYLKKGTANAQSLTASFWVKSNKTGTYIAELFDFDNSRQISKSYTINSADTWEKKTLTYAGDTTGTLSNDNGASLALQFFLATGSDRSSGTLNTSWGASVNANRAVGQVNLADSTANEWYITGVQLEAGTTASDFEFLPYDVNLDRCLRYYELVTRGETNKHIALGLYYNSTNLSTSILTTKTMRTAPSLDQTSGFDYYRFFRNNAVDAFEDFNLSGRTLNRVVELGNNTDVGGTGGQAGFITTNNTDAYLAFDAEL